MTYEELKKTAIRLKAELEELRSAAYITVECKYEDEVFYFIASYNIDTLEYEFNVTDGAFTEIRAFAQLPSRVLAEYGRFVETTLAYTMTEEEVEAKSAAPVQPLSVSEMAERAATLATEEELDDSEAELR